MEGRFWLSHYLFLCPRKLLPGQRCSQILLVFFENLLDGAWVLQIQTIAEVQMIVDYHCLRPILSPLQRFLLMNVVMDNYGLCYERLLVIS